MEVHSVMDDGNCLRRNVNLCDVLGQMIHARADELIESVDALVFNWLRASDVDKLTDGEELD